jgi:hypothetical protein
MEEAKFLKFLWDENIGYVAYVFAVYGLGLAGYWVMVG